MSAGTDPDAAGDAAGRYDTRVIAARTPLEGARTTNPAKITTVWKLRRSGPKTRPTTPGRAATTRPPDEA